MVEAVGAVGAQEFETSRKAVHNGDERNCIWDIKTT